MNPDFLCTEGSVTGMICPQLVVAVQQPNFACRTMAKAWGIPGEAVAKEGGFQDLETRRALTVELWERIALTTICS